MLTRVLARLSAMMSRRRIDAEVSEELQFHLTSEIDANIARGLAPVEARRIAMRDLGVTQTHEAVRDVRAIWLDDVRQDVRYTWRTARRNPGFFVVAMLVLALGIGANVAIFSIVNAMFFRPLPIRAPQEVVYVFMSQGGALASIASGDLKFFREHNDVFSALASHGGASYALDTGEASERLNGETVSANYFDVLGVAAALGRTFVPEEDRAATTQLALVISHDVWLRLFHRDPNVIGRQVKFDSNPFVIVGVMPAGFTGLSDPDTPSQFWVTPAQLVGDERFDLGDALIGRLKSGVSFDAANAQVAVLGEQVKRERAARFPERASKGPQGPYVLRRVNDVRMPSHPNRLPMPGGLITALGVVTAIVLLIAATNIAGLLLARGIARTSELAIRRGIGAGVGRLVRQLLTEAVTLALASGAIGLWFSRVLLDLYRQLDSAPYRAPASLDTRVVLFTLGVCLLTGVLVGLAPARQALRVNVLGALGGGSAITQPARRRMRRAILIPQVALALVLLLVAGVHARAQLAIEHADLGFEISDNVTLFGIFLGSPGRGVLNTSDQAAMQKRDEARRERGRTFHRNVLDNLSRIPGVQMAATTQGVALQGGRTWQPAVISREGFRAGTARVPGPYQPWVVSPDFRRLIGIPLVQGRDFDERDGPGSPKAALINESLAKQLWPNQNPIGQSLTTSWPNTPDDKLVWLEVVGVIGDLTGFLDFGEPQRTILVPVEQQWQAPMILSVAVRQGGASGATMREVREAIMRADPLDAVEINNVATLADIADRVLYERRLAAAILAISGLAGLLLASIGLYGVIAFSVEERKREIGIRTTLGAKRSDVLRLILQEGLVVAAIGAGIGIAASVGALRVAKNLVGQSPGMDLLTFTLVPIAVTAVVLLACYVPARRAAKVDPLVVLRQS